MAEPIRRPLTGLWQVAQPKALCTWFGVVPMNGEVEALWQPTQLAVMGVLAVLTLTVEA